MTSHRVGIVSAGAWGTALALAAVNAGSKVTLWSRSNSVVKEINSLHTHSSRLPGITIDSEVWATNNLADLEKCKFKLLALPSVSLGSICSKLQHHMEPDNVVCVASKGVELGSGKLMIDVASERLGTNNVTILSGPTFAFEVAKSLPCAVTLAGQRKDTEKVAGALSHSAFRIYLSDDKVGVSIGGAVKNVIAIACGISTGLGFGNNAQAALISRGLREITKLGLALGARHETLAGLSGLGDLVLTCTSEQSRNYRFGLAVGLGADIKGKLKESHSVVEGANTAPAVIKLANRLNVEMPICQAVDSVLKGTIKTKDAVQKLLSRPVENEFN